MSDWGKAAEFPRSLDKGGRWAFISLSLAVTGTALTPRLTWLLRQGIILVIKKVHHFACICLGTHSPSSHLYLFSWKTEIPQVPDDWIWEMLWIGFAWNSALQLCVYILVLRTCPAFMGPGNSRAFCGSGEMMTCWQRGEFPALALWPWWIHSVQLMVTTCPALTICLWGTGYSGHLFPWGEFRIPSKRKDEHQTSEELGILFSSLLFQLRQSEGEGFLKV